eukprot:SAG31_NODE_13413_length_871_cov_1.040155_1_plen_191_part_00
MTVSCALQGGTFSISPGFLGAHMGDSAGQSPIKIEKLKVLTARRAATSARATWHLSPPCCYCCSIGWPRSSQTPLVSRLFLFRIHRFCFASRASARRRPTAPRSSDAQGRRTSAATTQQRIVWCLGSAAAQPSRAEEFSIDWSAPPPSIPRLPPQPLGPWLRSAVGNGTFGINHARRPETAGLDIIIILN